MGPLERPGRSPQSGQIPSRSAISLRLDWRVLVPGLTQITWCQRERGLVFLLSFLTSLGTSLFCWGNWFGWCFLAFCGLTHLAAYLDLARQCAFPVFRRNTAVAAAALGLGLTLYLPFGLLLHSYAFATSADASTGVGYLVNCLAYLEKEPSPGQTIWMQLSPASTPRAGEVLAVAGQAVEWTGRTWQVDGNKIQSKHPGSLPHFPGAWGFQVPPNHVLIEPEAASSAVEPGSGLVIVSRDQIVGRAWARYYPFWERCLL